MTKCCHNSNRSNQHFSLAYNCTSIHHHLIHFGFVYKIKKAKVIPWVLLTYWSWLSSPFRSSHSMFLSRSPCRLALSIRSLSATCSLANSFSICKNWHTNTMENFKAKVTYYDDSTLLKKHLIFRSKNNCWSFEIFFKCYQQRLKFKE